jgi:hypothetical protein
MAQHDYNIANALFPAVRGDVNDAYAAIVTNNSGATAPVTTFPSMWWHDTANNIIKIRNLTNDAWVSVFNVATASSFAPGPTGPTGATGATGATGPAADTSTLMPRAGGAFSGAVTGPSGIFTYMATDGLDAKSISVSNVGSPGTINVYNGTVNAKQFRFSASGVGGDVGWDWNSGLGVVYTWAGATKGYFDNSGNAVFPNFIIYSDRKLKKNIRNLATMGFLVDEVSPKSFQMKKDDQKIRWGFVAQDFDGLPPQFIAADGKALDTMALVAVLWKALQETRAEVQSWQRLQT